MTEMPVVVIGAWPWGWRPRRTCWSGAWNRWYWRPETARRRR